jgi:hypothetical protein
MARRLVPLILLLPISACEQRPSPPVVESSTTAASISTPKVESTTGVSKTTRPESTTGRIGVGEPYTLSHIRVTVRKVNVGKVPLKQTDGSIDYSKEPSLMVLLRIENIGQKGQPSYNTWVPDLDTAKTVAKLADDSGVELKRVTLGFGNNVKDRTTLDTLTPGKVISDLLLFEVPNAKATHLDLDLPGANCGVRGTFQFRIPATAIGSNY